MRDRIYITESDFTRLTKLLERIDRDSYKKDREYLTDLEEELGKAIIVTPEKVPGDVITMNSTVRLRDLDSEEEFICSLVFPEDSDFSQNKISILAPIGTALIGYRLGDIIEWKVPAGTKRVKVEEILYQPEAAGDYHL